MLQLFGTSKILWTIVLFSMVVLVNMFLFSKLKKFWLFSNETISLES
jgi:hypothetical protein